MGVDEIRRPGVRKKFIIQAEFKDEQTYEECVDALNDEAEKMKCTPGEAAAVIIEEGLFEFDEGNGNQTVDELTGNKPIEPEGEKK